MKIYMFFLFFFTCIFTVNVSYAFSCISAFGESGKDQSIDKRVENKSKPKKERARRTPAEQREYEAFRELMDTAYSHHDLRGLLFYGVGGFPTVLPRLREIIHKEPPLESTTRSTRKRSVDEVAKKKTPHYIETNIKGNARGGDERIDTRSDAIFGERTGEHPHMDLLY